MSLRWLAGLEPCAQTGLYEKMVSAPGKLLARGGVFRALACQIRHFALLDWL